MEKRKKETANKELKVLLENPKLGKPWVKNLQIYYIKEDYKGREKKRKRNYKGIKNPFKNSKI